MHQTSRQCLIGWQWSCDVYSWSRFFLRTDKRTNEGNPRGPRGPKKKRNGGKGKDENNSRQRARQTDSHRVFCQGWQISIITVQAFRVMKICTGRDFRNIGDQALSKIFWMHFLGEKQFLDCMKCVLIHTNKQMSYWYPPLTVLSSFSNCFMPRQSNNVIHVTLNFPSGGQSQIQTAGIWCDLTELLFIKTLIWHHPVSWQW